MSVIVVHNSLGRRGGQMVSALDSGLNGALRFVLGQDA